MPQIYRFPFSIKQGFFSTPTVSGVFASEDLGFTPQLIIFFGNGRKPSEESTVLDDAGSFMGAASLRLGTINQWVTNHYQKDNVNPSQAKAFNSQSFCVAASKDDTGGFFIQASYLGNLGNTFVLNFSTVDSQPRTIFYYAIGGLGMSSDMVCGTMTNTSGTGAQSVTGLGFQPDAIIWKHDFVSTTVHDDLGVAVNATPLQDWCVSMVSPDNITPTTTKQIFDSTRRCIMNWGNGATQCEIEMTSYDSDGFTVNKVTQDTILRPYNFIAIKGIQVSAGTFTSVSAASTKEVSGLGFSPFLLLVVGTGQDSTKISMVQEAHAIRSYGIARSISEQATYAYCDTDGVVTTECNSFFSKDYALAILNNSSSATLGQRAYVSSFTEDGFVLTFDANDNQARRCFYLALGGTANQGSDLRKRIEGMDLAPKATHYMSIPHFTSGIAYADWTVYIFKNGDRLTDIPYDIRENPTGSYTFSFDNDGEDQAQWTLIAYETASPNDRYVEAWRVRSLSSDTSVANIENLVSNMGSGGSASGVGGSPGPSIGRS